MIPPCSGFGDAAFANGVEQRCFAVIDVTHDCDNGRPGHSILGDADFDCVEHHAFFERDEIACRVEVFADLLCHILVERLVDARENTSIHQLLDHVLGFDVELFSQILNGHAFSECNVAVFSRFLDFGLRPYGRRPKSLFGLPFVPLRAIDFVPLGRPSLLGHRLRRRRRQRSTTELRACPRRWRRSSSSLHSRSLWMRLSRTSRSRLSGTIHRSSGRWTLRSVIDAAGEAALPRSAALSCALRGWARASAAVAAVAAQ